MFLEVKANRTKGNIICIYLCLSIFVVLITFISACPQNLHFFFHLNHQKVYSVPASNVNFKYPESAVVLELVTWKL
jgi:hypothetical protein